MQKSLLIVIFAVGVLLSAPSRGAERPASPVAGLPSISAEPLEQQREVAQRFLQDNGIESDRLQVDEAKKTLSLNLAKTGVSDIKALAGLTALRELNLSETKVSDLKPLASLTGLNKLVLYGTPIDDVSPLQTLTGLTWLNFGKTQVRDLKPLASLTALKDLELHWTPVTDLRPLAGLKALEILNLYKVPVSDLTPLYGLAKLQIVNLGETGAGQKTMAAFSQRHPKVMLLVTDPAVY